MADSLLCLTSLDSDAATILSSAKSIIDLDLSVILGGYSSGDVGNIDIGTFQLAAIYFERIGASSGTYNYTRQNIGLFIIPNMTQRGFSALQYNLNTVTPPAYQTNIKISTDTSKIYFYGYNGSSSNSNIGVSGIIAVLS